MPASLGAAHTLPLTRFAGARQQLQTFEHRPIELLAGAYAAAVLWLAAVVYIAELPTPPLEAFPGDPQGISPNMPKREKWRGKKLGAGGERVACRSLVIATQLASEALFA